MPKDNDWKKRLGVVFSTNPDFDYQEEEVPQPQLLENSRQPLRLNIERKGRGGKTVTVVSGFVGPDGDLQALCRTLKSRCGTGGSVKDGLILIQGDKRSVLLPLLHSLGYTGAR